jgi:RHS repeat-associated protein
MQSRLDYDLWGNQTVLTGAAPSFGYTGHFAYAGLWMALYRAYDAKLGRWLNRDPLGELGFELVRDQQQPNFPFETQSVNWWQGGTYFGRPKASTAELLPDGPNLYGFVHNNPINAVDPFGDVSWGWPVVPPPGYPPTFPPETVKPPTIDPCLVDCAKKCALAHLPMRAACATGCIGAGPGYMACLLPCQTAVTISQTVCTAACYAGSKL